MAVRGRALRAAFCGAVLLASLTPTGAAAAPVASSTASTPGAVVSQQPLPEEVSLPGAGTATKLEYRTEWRSGEPTVATGALFLPEGDAPEGGWPVIAWAHGTTGVGDDCALTTRTPRSALERTYLRHWLDSGYAIVSADFPGLGSEGLHRYLDGPSAANSIVDIVRAARAGGAPLSERWLVMGQSQGGHAALHTATIATFRAPELDFRGTVATGAPANLERAFTIGVPGFPDPGLGGLVSFSGYIFAGLRDAYPEVDVDSFLTPVGREVVDRAEELCYDDLEESVRGIRVGELLARPLAEEPMAALLADYLAAPANGYDRPVFLAHGVHDVVVPLPLSAALAADMKAAGADVDYRVYMAGHYTTVERSLPEVGAFVARSFE
ncbi:lipase [Rhodococcus gordoniae]|uniref:Lipase n=1 Tax=Rhodococcus gordoniae TaxID=223392 RepID=A0A379LTQ8_9NOCA|nr:lipase family protein [Rhodococcus gordoniae]SUE13461.1 lipase [Rhodococcus gordoniae]